MKKWILALIIVLAFVVQMAVVMPSGSHYCQNGILCGTYFWGAHEHDGVWHMALINNGLSVWPGRFPTYANAMLSGYNALLDWGLRIIYLVTRIPTLTLYFKIVPLLWFGSMVFVWSKFAKVYSQNKWYVPAILFFVFFGNSFSYLLKYYHEGIIWGASGLISMQSPSMLTNIQFALTLPLLGLMLIIFQKENLKWRDNFWVGMLNFLIMGLKFYGGVVSIVMSSVFALNLLIQKKWKEGIIAGFTATMGFGLATLLFYNPLASIGGPSILSFRPLATVHPIIEEAGLVFAPSIANLRNNLYATGGGYRLILIEIATLAVFIFFNWGTRIVGLWGIKRKPFDMILLSGIFAGLMMNILFTQRGEWWNTVQFLYYATFLSNIYAAKVVAQLANSGYLKKIIAGVIIILTIPNAIDCYRIFASFPPHSYVSDTEMRALTELKKLPDGIVLSLPLYPIAGHEDQLPKPLYNMYDTAYVAAFSGKQTYLNDLVQMRLTGIDYFGRLEKVEKSDCSILSEVTYVYVAGSQGLLRPWQQCQEYALTEIFSNEEAAIYRVTTETPNQ